MGLLDEREPELWRKMERYNFMDKFQMKLLSLRKKRTVKAVPKYNFPMFQNHMLSQQGMAGAAKVVVVMAAIYLPLLGFHALNASRHEFYEE